MRHPNLVHLILVEIDAIDCDRQEGILVTHSVRRKFVLKYLTLKEPE